MVSSLCSSYLTVSMARRTAPIKRWHREVYRPMGMMSSIKTSAFPCGSMLISTSASRACWIGSVVRGGVGGGTSLVNGLYNVCSSHSGSFMIAFARSQVASENGHHFAGQYPPPNGRRKAIRQMDVTRDMHIAARCPNRLARRYADRKSTLPPTIGVDG